MSEDFGLDLSEVRAPGHMRVQRGQRFYRDFRCPNCGGASDEPPGYGVRCWGFVSDDGETFYCTQGDADQGDIAGSPVEVQGADAWCHTRTGVCPCGAVDHGDNPASVQHVNGAKERLRPVANRRGMRGRRLLYALTFHDADGQALFEVTRRYTFAGEAKYIRPRRWHGQLRDGEQAPDDYDPEDGYIYNLDGLTDEQKETPYALPHLIEAHPKTPVYITEGPNKAQRLIAAGLVATSGAFGAGAWTDNHGKWLRDRDCVLLPDDDEKGRTHCDVVRESLLRCGAARVVVVSLDGLPAGGDIIDWLDARHTVEELGLLTREAFEHFMHDPSQNVQTSNLQNVHATPEHSGRAVRHGKVTITELVARRASEVTEKPLTWLWQDRIPQGKATFLDGEPDKGKSTLMLWLAAQVSCGKPLYLEDGVPLFRQGGRAVVLMSCEDDPEDTIVPRLRMMGACLANVHLIEGVRCSDGRTLLPQIPRDLPLLEQRIREAEAVLAVVDPITGYLDGRVDTHNDAQVRHALYDLHALAQRQGVAVVGIRHFNKNRNETNPILRGGGSIGLVGFARSSLVVLPHEDPARQDVRYLALGKHNLTRPDIDSLMYRLVGVPTTIDGQEVTVSHLEWLGTDTRSARTLMEASRDGASASSRNDDHKRCLEVLYAILGDGQEHRSEEVNDAVKEKEISSNVYNDCRKQLVRIGRLVNKKHGGRGEGSYWTMQLKTTGGGRA